MCGHLVQSEPAKTLSTSHQISGASIRSQPARVFSPGHMHERSTLSHRAHWGKDSHANGSHIRKYLPKNVQKAPAGGTLGIMHSCPPPLPDSFLIFFLLHFPCLLSQTVHHTLCNCSSPHFIQCFISCVLHLIHVYFPDTPQALWLKISPTHLAARTAIMKGTILSRLLPCHLARP